MKPETKHRILWISVIVLFALCITEGFLLFGRSKSEESIQLSLAGLSERVQGVEGLSGDIKKSLQNLLDPHADDPWPDQFFDEEFFEELDEIREKALEKLHDGKTYAGEDFQEEFEEEIDRIKREAERFRKEIEESLGKTLRKRERRRSDTRPEDVGARPRHRSRGLEVEVTQKDEPEALVLVLKSPGLQYDNLNVEVDEEKITLRGDRESERKTEGRKDKTYSRRRTARSFTRTFPTPEGVDASSAEVEVDVDEEEIRIRFPKART